MKNLFYKLGVVKVIAVIIIQLFLFTNIDIKTGFSFSREQIFAKLEKGQNLAVKSGFKNPEKVKNINEAKIILQIKELEEKKNKLERGKEEILDRILKNKELTIEKKEKEIEKIEEQTKNKIQEIKKQIEKYSQQAEKIFSEEKLKQAKHEKYLNDLLERAKEEEEKEEAEPEQTIKEKEQKLEEDKKKLEEEEDNLNQQLKAIEEEERKQAKIEEQTKLEQKQEPKITQAQEPQTEKKTWNDIFQEIWDNVKNWFKSDEGSSVEDFVKIMGKSAQENIRRYGATAIATKNGTAIASNKGTNDSINIFVDEIQGYNDKDKESIRRVLQLFEQEEVDLKLAINILTEGGFLAQKYADNMKALFEKIINEPWLRVLAKKDNKVSANDKKIFLKFLKERTATVMELKLKLNQVGKMTDYLFSNEFLNKNKFNFLIEIKNKYENNKEEMLKKFLLAFIEKMKEEIGKDNPSKTLTMEVNGVELTIAKAEAFEVIQAINAAA